MRTQRDTTASCTARPVDLSCASSASSSVGISLSCKAPFGAFFFFRSFTFGYWYRSMT